MTAPPPTQSTNFAFASNGMHDKRVIATASRTPRVTVDPAAERLSTARLQFRTCVQSEADWRRKATEELNFVDGLEHWDQSLKEERSGRPCLTFDRIGPAIDQVVNDARQNPPEAKFLPVGNGADKDTAEILQGLDRNIDQDSDALTAYMTAYEHAVKVGRGWFRINFEYENDESVEQKIVVRRIPNLFSVYPDPAATEFDYSDMQFCFVTEDLDLPTYKRLYPKSRTAGLVSFESIGDKVQKEWFPKGSVRVAEYWWIETEDLVICQLRDGQIVAAAGVTDETQVIHRRTVQKRKVFGAKITGAEILAEWEWPGKWIPLIPVLGKEIIQNGKRGIRGMIRAAMDANLQYDFMRSKEVETIGLSSIVQWLVAEGQVEGFEYQWNQANRKSMPFMEYKTKNAAGEQLPPPQRIWPQGPLGAISGAIQNSAEDIRATTATWNPSLGAPSPEASGRAINARQRESDNAHFNYHDNLYRALRHSARIKLDLIPHIYNEARLVTILDPDGTSRLVHVNREFFEKGVKKLYRLDSPARYDVTITTGPSYPSRRAEAADRLVQLAQFMPILAQRAPDLIVAALDMPDGDQIAERIRPPDVQQEADGQQPVPPQIQQAIAQKDQLIQMLQAKLGELQRLIENKKLDLESRERIASRDNATSMVVAEMKANSDAAIHSMQSLMADIQGRLDRLHEKETLSQEIEADQREAEQQRQHEQQSQQADQQHQQDTQQSDQQHQQTLQQQKDEAASAAGERDRQQATPGAPPDQQPMAA